MRGALCLPRDTARCFHKHGEKCSVEQRCVRIPRRRRNGSRIVSIRITAFTPLPCKYGPPEARKRGPPLRISFSVRLADELTAEVRVRRLLTSVPLEPRGAFTFKHQELHGKQIMPQCSHCYGGGSARELETNILHRERNLL